MASDLLKTLDFGDGVKRAVAPEWSNVQNPPFGKKYEVMMDGIFDFVYSEDDGGAVAVVEDEKITYEPGATYLVELNGNAYECVTMGSPEMGYVGNLTGSTGEPFIGVVANGQFVCVDVTQVADVSQTLKVSLVSIKKISDQFIDFDSKFKVYYSSDSGNVNYLYEDEACTTKVTQEDFLKVARKIPFVIKEGAHIVTPLYIDTQTSNPYNFVIVYKDAGLSTKQMLYTDGYTIP